MRKLSGGNASIILLAFLGLGCKGLTVDLSANPDPADPGQSVQWDISVRNDTDCTTVEDMTELPDPFPDSFGAIAFIFGFVPELDDIGPQEFCRLVMACGDPSCVTTRVEEALGPDVAAALSARARTATAGQPDPLPAVNTCNEISGLFDGVFGVCVFEALSPGETATATFTATAPDTGSRNAAQVALAFAPAEGEDCRPGTEIGDDAWILGGCFPLDNSTPAPTLSPIATGVAAGLLLITGMAGLYRRRRS